MSIGATFTKLTPTVHLDMITDVACWFVSLTYISCLSDHGKKEMVRSILQYLLVLHSPNLHQLFILT